MYALRRQGVSPTYPASETVPAEELFGEGESGVQCELVGGKPFLCRGLLCAGLLLLAESNKVSKWF